MNETLVNAFIVVASLVIIVQGVMLVAFFLSLRKTSTKLEALATTVEGKAIPLMTSAQAILDDAGPRIREVSLNMAEVSERVRSQAENMDSAMSEVVDRLRLQSIRVDDLVTRTIDKVEETTEMVQHTVITPVKQINGLVHALTVGIGAFMQRRRRAAADAAEANASPDDGMFI
jgi:hypothetical protein